MNFRLTLVLVVTLAVILGVIFLRPKTAPPAAPQPPIVYTIDEQALNFIEVRAEGKRESYWKDKDGRWHIGSLTGIGVDARRWGGIPFLLSGPRSKRVITESPSQADLQAYGLNNPLLRVTMGFVSGDRFEVQLGAKTPDQGSNYALNKGFTTVYLIDETWGGVLSRLATDVPIPPPPTATLPPLLGPTQRP
ncbi:MAG: DUF4340 domain-containing protein [Dehalococcoidia bacterium]|nr:DUF4340 domain-containing protein [Dehalococcoidia bacterium]